MKVRRKNSTAASLYCCFEFLTKVNYTAGIDKKVLNRHTFGRLGKLFIFLPIAQGYSIVVEDDIRKYK
jgi:hypothetical protein